MRILVTGSRDWTDTDAVRRALDAYMGSSDDYESTVVVHGAAKGLDTIAADIAENELGAVVDPHPAKWGQHGKRAGRLRNQEMVDTGADVCIAFPLPGSRGTYDCAARAIQAGIPVHWILEYVRAEDMQRELQDAIDRL